MNEYKLSKPGKVRPGSQGPSSRARQSTYATRGKQENSNPNRGVKFGDEDENEEDGMMMDEVQKD